MMVIRLVKSAAMLAAIFMLTSAYAAEKVTVRLDWLPSGQQAPFYIAKARGFYKEQDLEVELLDGKGSGSTIQAVGSNLDTFGFASLDAMALLASKGIPVVAVGCITQKSANAVISLAEKPISELADLVGKKIGLVPDGAAARLFPALLKHNNINSKDVEVIQLGYSTIYSALLQGHVDGVIAYDVDGSKVNKVRATAKPLLYADFGLNTLGAGIIVNAQTLKDRPDLVARFTKATMKGVEATVADPLDAGKAITDARADAEAGLILDSVQLAKDHLHTPASEGKPTGFMADADWEVTKKILVEAFDLPPDTDVSKFYTNEFIGK
jgi:NitT/TauT family transport system substrate-binding protein